MDFMTIIDKFVIATPLLYLTWITIACPCKPVLHCILENFFLTSAFIVNYQIFGFLTIFSFPIGYAYYINFKRNNLEFLLKDFVEKNISPKTAEQTNTGKTEEVNDVPV